VAVSDAEALAAFRRVSELEGILPALEPSHALAWLMAHPSGGVDLVTLSGRGDKDLAEVLALEGGAVREGPGSARTGAMPP
jgi:tryptophan synthase beta chain